MRKSILTSLCVLFLGVVIFASTAQAEVIWHDPWLNWDFINVNGIAVNDLDIWVDNPNWNPGANWWAAPFTTMTVTNNIVWPVDGNLHTMISYTGAWIPSMGTGHGGLYMIGSGRVLDAYWTLGGAKIGLSTAITYERTRIENDPELHMELSIAPGFFEDHYGHEAGWTNIRTFANIPADMLGLADLNKNLNLANLAAYQVTPRRLDGSEILPTDRIWMNNPDSFFDVFLAQLLPHQVSPNYEALLVADVLMASDPVALGTFWNLNPQSPEPATLGLLLLGGLALFRRR